MFVFIYTNEHELFEFAPNAPYRVCNIGSHCGRYVLEYQQSPPKLCILFNVENFEQIPFSSLPILFYNIWWWIYPSMDLYLIRKRFICWMCAYWASSFEIRTFAKQNHMTFLLLHLKFASPLKSLSKNDDDPSSKIEPIESHLRRHRVFTFCDYYKKMDISMSLLYVYIVNFLDHLLTVLMFWP